MRRLVLGRRKLATKVGKTKKINLSDLYRRAVAIHRKSSRQGLVVEPSIPILYFGSLQDYLHSSFRIITVGLNPSFREFEKTRFNTSRVTLQESTKLEATLCEYFRRSPYEWFERPLEKVLQSLGASFYGSNYPSVRKTPSWWRPQKNVALHTDLGSPLATKKAWSKLSRIDREKLQSDGFPLWVDLIERLAPDIIILSVSKKFLQKFGDVHWLESVKKARGSVPFLAGHWRNTILVWSPASRRPFRYFSNETGTKFAVSLNNILRRLRKSSA
jgi:hypothetical protein